jgi:putative flippase GtrA
MIALQAILFCLVGVALTAVDFLLFRWAHDRMHWNRYAANLFSTTVAIIVSLAANWNLVFRPEHFVPGSGTLRFLLVTLVSAWGIQNAVLFLLAKCRSAEPLIQRFLAASARLPGQTGALLAGLSGHKLAAILCGLTWNFCWYRWWVFV